MGTLYNNLKSCQLLNLKLFFPCSSLGPPSQPRHVTVISSGATWSHLSWEEPSLPGFPSSSSKLFVVVATRRTDGLVHKSLPTAGLSANITGLLPNSDYELTVLAQSVLGGVVANSSPSDLAFATTTTTGNVYTSCTAEHLF